MLLGLTYSFAMGNGHLSDLDPFAGDTATLTLTGLEQAPASRRLGEYLARMTPENIDALHEVCRKPTRPVLAASCYREQHERGYVPIFVDGSAIEVSGRYFEHAHVGYNGMKQYWLQADNAYYRKDVVSYCRQRGWDYSISVTHGTYKRPILAKSTDVPETAWEKVGYQEDAMIVSYKPGEWKQAENYLIVRSQWDGTQKLAFPRYTVICVSRKDLPCTELLLRHRRKQGMENELKGPLNADHPSKQPLPSLKAETIL